MACCMCNQQCISLYHETIIVFILVITFADVTVNAAIYSRNLAMKIQGSTSGDYFGYSVALQGGPRPRIVIGAPRQGQRKVGSIYVCNVIESDSVNDKSCKSYTIDQKHVANVQNMLYKDNMFGACIDGGVEISNEILVGSPKLTENGYDNNYVTGGIFKLSEILKRDFRKYPINPGPLTQHSQYYFGYAQFGHSLHYVNSSEYLYGTPGFNHWRGDAFLASQIDGNVVPEARGARKRSRQRKKRELTETIESLLKLQESDSALGGYSVTSGRFFGHVSYVVALPNGNGMLGQLKMFRHEINGFGIQLENAFGLDPPGRKLAEHFGSTMASADLNGDGYDDLLIGAPNANENGAYDNGKVYVLISNGDGGFKVHTTIVGEPGSRLGTSITNLGKITLDQHESVAIGAPYEGDSGAVKVYVWMDSQLSLDSHVIMPNIESFGYSLSRAVDIDNNLFADFAVGAYKSDAITILKAKQVFFYKVKVKSNTLNADSSDSNLRVEICINAVSILNRPIPVETQISLEFDNRIKPNYLINNDLTTIPETVYCKTHSLELNPNVKRVEPLTITIKLQETTCDLCPVLSPTYPSVFREKIPFMYNCKNDICMPNIEIQSDITKVLVVGEKDIVPFMVKVSNTGDPAFACTMDVTSRSPIAISAVDNKRCINTRCEFNYILGDVLQGYSIDLRSWSMFQTNLDLEVNIQCVNVTMITSFASVKLIYMSKLIVDGPKLTKQYDSINGSTYDVEGAAIFHVKNEGPSNLQKAIYIVKIPRYSHDVQIIDIYQPNGYTCTPVDEAYDHRVDYKRIESDQIPQAAGFSQTSIFENRISCKSSHVRCMAIQCKIEGLMKDNTQVINIPTRVNITEILKLYRSTFSIVSTISKEGEDNEYIAELDIVDKQTIVESINVWIIIGSILGALILLALLVFVAYKFGFFSRPKHERLKEQNMEGPLEEVEMRKSVVESTDLSIGPSTDDKEELGGGGGY